MLELSYTARQASCAAIIAVVNTGSAFVSGLLEIRDGARPASPTAPATGTLLVAFPLSAPAFAAPVAGASALAGVPLDAVAVATGSPTWFRFYSRDRVGVIDGDIPADMVFSEGSIAVGRRCLLNDWTLTAP